MMVSPSSSSLITSCPGEFSGWGVIKCSFSLGVHPFTAYLVHLQIYLVHLQIFLVHLQIWLSNLPFNMLSPRESCPRDEDTSPKFDRADVTETRLKGRSRRQSRLRNPFHSATKPFHPKRSRKDHSGYIMRANILTNKEGSSGFSKDKWTNG